MNALFVTATDTDVGKTYFSGELINHLIHSKTFEAKEIAYFKPVQCGSPTDFDQISKETGVNVYTSYRLNYPSSPDYAASLENIEISIEKIKEDFSKLKDKYSFILVEGAGGVAVPLNQKQMVSDLIKELKLEAVLIIRPDLGTINHSISSIEHLQNKGIKLKGFYVSGKSREISEGYKLDPKEVLEQNTAALESIIRFTNTKHLGLKDIVSKEYVS